MARMSWRHIVADTAKATANSCRRTGTYPRDLDRIIFTSMFNDITHYGRRKVQGKRVDSAKRWPLMQQDSALVIGVSGVQDRNITGNTTSQDLLLMLLTGKGTNSLL